MSTIDDYKNYRNLVESCCGNPLHGKNFACVEANLVGPGIPAFCHPERCQLLFVGDFPTKSEIDQQTKFRSPFVDQRGKLLTVALVDSGLYGDDRMGFTNLVKCHMPTRRSWKKCSKTCSSFMQIELDIIRPLTVVLLGEAVGKIAYPEVVDAAGGWSHLLAEEIDYFDTHLLFLADPIEFKPTKRGEERDRVSYRYQFVEPLIKVKSRLMSHGDYHMFMYEESK
jgi:uracil-DNA glycosylase